MTQRKAGEESERLAEHADVIGRANEGEGVEALVVEIAVTIRRLDVSTCHITWSLAEGRESNESKDVLAKCQWQAVESEPPIGVIEAERP